MEKTSEENPNNQGKKIILVKYENGFEKIIYYGDLEINELKNKIKEIFGIEY